MADFHELEYCRKLAVTLAGLWKAACEDGIAPRSTKAAMERLQAEVSALASDCVDAGLITERKAQELYALAWGYVECRNCGQQLFVSPEEHILRVLPRRYSNKRRRDIGDRRALVGWQ